MNEMIIGMETISLEQSQQVSLQKRFDTKFVLGKSRLDSFLNDIRDDYFAMIIGDEIVQPYKTLYYDTEDFHLYIEHHNTRKKRFKVRTREYLQNGLIFNEIKVKDNRGRTVKTRQLRDSFETEFDTVFQNLALENGIPGLELKEQLYVFYDRTTLINKNFTERLTIDTNLSYWNQKEDVRFSFPELVIVEQKRERGTERSSANRALHRVQSYPTGFSKYCMGIAATVTGIKKNNLKEKFRLVERIQGDVRWNN